MKSPVEKLLSFVKTPMEENKFKCALRQFGRGCGTKPRHFIYLRGHPSPSWSQTFSTLSSTKTTLSSRTNSSATIRPIFMTLETVIDSDLNFLF